MSERIWYRSLYWRIALGFVVLVAVVLTAQALVTLWLAGRVAELLPGRTPLAFAEVVAADVSEALAGSDDVDLQAFVHERHGSAAQAFAVVTREGTVVLSQRVEPPPSIARAARAELFGTAGPGGGGRGGLRVGGRGAAPDAEVDTSVSDTQAPGSRRGFGRSGRAGRGGAAPVFEFAVVTVAGEDVGIVAVPAELPPLSTALRGLGPTLAAVGFVLLVLGTSAAALFVFRPAHRRLRGLEKAARALGAGEASARASEEGGDEVASLAKTFNEMAGDLDARAAALVEADRTRRQLLADISHELATPLAAIRGYAETLGMSHVDLDMPTRQRYLEVITDETERLGHVVGDLLDLARLEGGGIPFTHEPVAVGALFERVVQRNEPVLRDRQVLVTTSIADDAATVRGDRARLEQALQNLAANAIRHTPDGGTVQLRVTRDGDAVCIAVEDSGPGIPEEHLGRLFDRFYKADQSRTGTATPSGSGLGLSIVREIVARHGGQVTAANRPEGGARFDMRLPSNATDRQM